MVLLDHRRRVDARGECTGRRHRAPDRHRGRHEKGGLPGRARSGSAASPCVCRLRSRRVHASQNGWTRRDWIKDRGRRSIRWSKVGADARSQSGLTPLVRAKHELPQARRRARRARREGGSTRRSPPYTLAHPLLPGPRTPLRPHRRTGMTPCWTCVQPA